MDFTVPYRKGMDADRAFRAARDALGKGAEGLPMPVDFSSDPERREILGGAKGASVRLAFTDAGCVVTLKLPLMLRPFQGKIVESVKQALGRKEP